MILDDTSCDVKRHLAAIALLLAWAELITMVGRHPRLSRYNIYVTMFYKVIKACRNTHPVTWNLVHYEIALVDAT